MNKTGFRIIVGILKVNLLVCCACISAYAGCDCPSQSDCGDCRGGLTQLSLKYTANVPGFVIAFDNANIYISEVLRKNDIVELRGARENGNFEGNYITIFVNGRLYSAIPVNCTREILIGSEIGFFEVTGGNSLNGGSICCSAELLDTIPPEINNCPGDIKRDLSASECARSIEWIIPEASDDCSLDTLISSHLPGMKFPIGTTEVIYEAIDISGNVSTCKFDVIIRDKEQPVIYNCPEDIEVTANSGGEQMVVWGEPFATDNCDTPTMKSNISSGEIFSIGSTEVQYTATDLSGNKSKCSFIVTVKEDISIEKEGIGKVLTPNGDGINDEWKITNIEKHPGNQVTIFDRWGNIIYKATGYDNEDVVWRGTNQNNKIVPTGTYFYVIELNDSVSNMQKGFLELIR